MPSKRPELIVKLDAALRKNYPALREGLSAGAKRPELAKLDALTNGPLPALFRALYEWHDGGDAFYGNYVFLSIADVLESMAEMKSLLKANPKWKKSGWWREGWIPLLDDQGGNLFCLDLEGALGGKPGQIIRWEHETGPELGFASTEEWIGTVLQAIKEKTLLVENPHAFQEIYEKRAEGFPREVDPAKSKLREIERRLSKLSADGNKSLMRACVEKGLALAPNHEDFWLYVPHSLDPGGDSVRWLDRLIARLKPKRYPALRAYQWKAHILWHNIKDEAAALATLQEQIALLKALPKDELAGPHNAFRTYNLLAEIHAQADRAREAGEACEHGLALNPAPWQVDHAFWLAYATAYKGSAKKPRNAAFARAREGTEKHIEVYPEKAWAHYYLAYFCLMLDDAVAAVNASREAVKLDKSIRKLILDDEEYARVWSKLSK